MVIATTTARCGDEDAGGVGASTGAEVGARDRARLEWLEEHSLVLLAWLSYRESNCKILY